MNTYRFSRFALLLLLTGCHDDSLSLRKLDNLFEYEQKEIKGHVRLQDNYMETVKVAAPADVDVYVSTDPMAEKYLYRVKTDKVGLFTFPYQPKDAGIPLYIVSKYISGSGTSSVPFSGSFNLADIASHKNPVDGMTELVLTPSYPGGILKVKLIGVDSNTQPIGGGSVYLFTNTDQATSLTATAPVGVVEMKTTNAQGVAFFYNLKTNTYHAAGRLVNADGVMQYTDPMSVTVNEDQTQSDKSPSSFTPLVIKPVAATVVQSQLAVTVTNQATGEYLVGMNVYLFASKLQAHSVEDTSGAQGYLYGPTMTVAEGKATIKNVAGGTYYIAITGNLPGKKKVAEIYNRAVVLAPNVLTPYSETIPVTGK